MKISTKALCVLALLGCLALPTLTATPDCTTMGNGFLAWVKGLPNGESILLAAANTARPTGGWEVCDTTWGTDGTCCDISKIKDAFKRLGGDIQKGWKDFMDGFKQFKDASKKIKDAAGGKDVKTKVDAAKADTSGAYDTQGLTGDQAQKIMDKIDTLDDQLKTFKEKAQACFKASSDVRSNIFCSGCQTGAGFTWEPSTTSLSYKFASGSCNAALEACVPVWSLMFNLQAQMLLAVQVKRKEKGTKENAPKGPPPMPRGKNFGDVATLFTNCPDGKVVGTTCTQENLDTMCGLFISFKKPEPMAKKMDDTDASTAQSSGTAPAPASRLLQSSSNDGTGAAAAGGISLNSEAKPMDSGVSIDASNTGNNSNASGNILIVSLASIAATLFYF